jgi:hypothetical protein
MDPRHWIKANRSYCDGQVREEEEETDEPMEQEPEQQQQTARTKKTLNYEEYKKMSYLLIKYIKQKEEQGELEEASTGAHVFYHVFYILCKQSPVLRIQDVYPGS